MNLNRLWPCKPISLAEIFALKYVKLCRCLHIATFKKETLILKRADLFVITFTAICKSFKILLFSDFIAVNYTKTTFCAICT